MTTSDIIAIVSGVISLVAIALSALVARSQYLLARRDQLFPLVGGLLDEFRDPEFKMRMAYIKDSLSTDCPPDAAGD